MLKYSVPLRGWPAGLAAARADKTITNYVRAAIAPDHGRSRPRQIAGELFLDIQQHALCPHISEPHCLPRLSLCALQIALVREQRG